MTMVRPALVPVIVRLGVLLAGVGVVLAPAQLHTVPAAVTVVGVVLAVAAPSRVGAATAMAGFVLAWTTAYGWHVAPSAPRTIAAAATLYALHATSSLAAFLPLDAYVGAGVIRRYALRCLPVIVGSAAVIGVSYAMPRSSGSALVELAGLVGVLVVVAIPASLVIRGGSRGRT